MKPGGDNRKTVVKSTKKLRPYWHQLKTVKDMWKYTKTAQNSFQHLPALTYSAIPFQSISIFDNSHQFFPGNTFYITYKLFGNIFYSYKGIKIMLEPTW